MIRTLTALALSLSVSFAVSGRAVAEPASPPTYYRILLEGALFNTKDGAKDPTDVRELVMDLEQVGDNWGAIYAMSRNYNMGTHKGSVKSAKVTPTEITLNIGTEITGDKWVPGGQGDYTVTLTRNDDGTLLGSFSGNYNGVPLKGKASGTFYSPKPDKNFVPLAPQEHPRLLFRASDLPELRKKFTTPFGQAAKAKLEAEEYLAGRKPAGDPFVPKKPLWAQTEQLALVYDLCYDALSPDYRARYRSWAADLGFKVYFAPESLGTTNWHVVSNHVANVYSGMTFSALALFDEPSAEPVAPIAPFLEETLPPAPASFKPGKGVPVVPFVVGQSPTEWIHTEPLRRTTADDPREQFYGLENLRAEVGTQVKVGDFTLTFGEQPAENKSTAAVGGIAVGHLIQADAAARAKEPFTMVASTVIEVKEPGQYMFINPVSRANLAQASVAGKLLVDRQVVKLEPGLYPLTQMVQWRMLWGEIAPHFAAATPADVEAWKTKSEQIKAAYDTRLSSYASVFETWKRTGGGDPAFGRLLRLSRFTSALHCEHAVGKGGFQGEVGHYSEDASSGHAKLWPAYRRVMGYDLTPDHEYPDYIPRKLVGGDQDINGITRIGGEYFPALYPTIRPEWQPDILSAWHKEMKIASPDAVTQVLDADPVRSFLYYPLTDKAAPIGTNLPKVWEAPGLGYFAIRNGWDKDAFVAQVFLKAQYISGWSGGNAGTYRLHGFGQDWATGSSDRVRARQEENVVWLPESDLDEGARGKLTYFAADGKTMIVSVNLDEVYERKGRFWYTRYGNLRMAARPQADQEIPPPSGITGMRSLAFDYSGVSGAPCLFALVDKIDGGTDKDRRLWLFQPALSGVKGNKVPPGALAEVVKARKDGFIVQPVGATASLEGIFAQPADAKVATEPLNYSYIKNFGKQKGTKIEVKVNAISVPGTGNYFFVGTVAPGGHPPVKIEGSGLDAVVTVGRRTVKFDGQKIVFGQSN